MRPHRRWRKLRRQPRQRSQQEIIQAAPLEMGLLHCLPYALFADMPATQITIDAQHNKVLIDTGLVTQEVCLNRRWAAYFLAQLVARQSRGEPLTLECLQAELLREGQAQPLNRAQVQRIVKCIEAMFAEMASPTPALTFTPGEQCGGPWRLSTPREIKWHITHPNQESTLLSSVKSVAHAQRCNWQGPLMCRDASLGDLHQFMNILMLADDLFRHSDFQAAHDELQAAYAMHLTPEGLQLVLIKDAYALKHHGQYAAARQCCTRIIQIANTNTKAPAMGSLAKFMLDRIRYDENPAVAYESLRHTAQVPENLHIPNPIALAEWHNLQALIARRRMLAVPREAEQTHWDALTHFESALYLRMASQDASKVPDVLFNLAFHLQKAHGLGLASLIDLCIWYGMAVRYDHRHNLMGSSAWDYIFMGHLWLDHHAELQSLMQQSAATGLDLNTALLLDKHHPWQAAFYQEAIRQAKLTGDDRQQGIAHILAWRFAQEWPSPGLACSTQKRAVSALVRHNPQLYQRLLDEGYTELQRMLANPPAN